MDFDDVVIRPVGESDLDALFKLARLSGVGITTLPHDRDLLEDRVLRSCEASRKLTDEPGGEEYLFVAEDTRTDRLVGTAGIVSRVGGFKPFYAFRRRQEKHESEQLGKTNSVEYLTVLKEHDGPCELNSLFVHPDYRNTGLGTILSRSRFVYVAEHKNRFDDTIIAELRGKGSDDGPPPFWDGVARHFFPMDFSEADSLTLRDKSFIDDMVPEHPIYLPLLPDPTREAVGGIHELTKPAAEILYNEGFEPTDLVDVFDAGMILSASRSDVRTIRNLDQYTVDGLVDSEKEESRGLVATFDPEFALMYSPVEISTDSACRLPEKVLRRLNLEAGDTVLVSQPTEGTQ